MTHDTSDSWLCSPHCAVITVNHSEAGHGLWQGKIQIIILSPFCTVFSSLWPQKPLTQSSSDAEPNVLISSQDLKQTIGEVESFCQHTKNISRLYSLWFRGIQLELINECVTQGIAHLCPKVFLWDPTEITSSHSQADNGLPTPAILHTHRRSARGVCACVCEVRLLSMKDK